MILLVKKKYNKNAIAEALLKRDKLYEIWETDEEKLLSIKDLKEKYINYAKSHFRKNPPIVIKNLILKWDIEITKQVIGE